MTKRYVLTGAPGSGKTSVLRALGERGFPVIPEAATDVIGWRQREGISEPWEHAGFVDEIATLQSRRQREADGVPLQIYDRSPLCTLALARYLGHPVTPLLAAEVSRVMDGRIYEKSVFLLLPLGFIEPTAARRISYADSIEFGRLHEQVYREHGFDTIEVAPGTVRGRADAVADFILGAS